MLYCIFTEFPRVFAYTAHNIVDAYKQRYCNITCIVSGDPKPTIYWTKNGRPIDLASWQWTSATGQLAVPCFQRTDTAIYRCIGRTAGIGTDSRTIPIKVVELGKCSIVDSM